MLSQFHGGSVWSPSSFPPALAMDWEHSANRPRMVGTTESCWDRKRVSSAPNTVYCFSSGRSKGGTATTLVPEPQCWCDPKRVGSGQNPMWKMSYYYFKNIFSFFWRTGPGQVWISFSLFESGIRSELALADPAFLELPKWARCCLTGLGSNRCLERQGFIIDDGVFG